MTFDPIISWGLSRSNYQPSLALNEPVAAKLFKFLKASRTYGRRTDGRNLDPFSLPPYHLGGLDKNGDGAGGDVREQENKWKELEEGDNDDKLDEKRWKQGRNISKYLQVAIESIPKIGNADWILRQEVNVQLLYSLRKLLLT